MNAGIDISNIVLKTQRLILRPFAHSDLDDFFEYASIDGVGQMAGWLPHESRDVSLGILNHFMEEKKTFALELDGKVIGSLGIEQYKEAELPEFDHLACREIGYVLARDYWGRGLMAEAVREVIRWLFEDIGLDLIFCSYFVKNKQSARVQEKCGFRFYFRRVSETRFGTFEDSNLNILRKEEWAAMGAEQNLQAY